MTEREFTNQNQEALQPSQAEILPILQEQAHFLHDISELTGTIDTLLQPSSEKHAFEFLMLPYSSRFELPDILKPLANDIDSIHVYIGDARQAEKPDDIDVPAFLSVDFDTPTTRYNFSNTGLSEEVETPLYKIDTTGYQHSEPDFRFVGRIGTLGQISRKEINAFLMSIVIPNERGDYAAYSESELQSSSAFSSLCELLEKQALSHKEDYEFVLSDNDSELFFSKEDGHVISFTFNYFDYSKNRPMHVEYNNKSDLNLKFFVYEDDTNKTLVSPSNEEINYARMILRKELEPVTPVGLDTAQLETRVDTTNSLEANEEKELAAFSKESVERMLRELGLDSPDASA